MTGYIHIHEGKIYNEPLKEYNNKKANIHITRKTKSKIQNILNFCYLITSENKIDSYSLQQRKMYRTMLTIHGSKQQAHIQQTHKIEHYIYHYLSIKASNISATKTELNHSLHQN
jgi:hypothetical protein